MSSPLISVIIPLYNSERFLDRCILGVTAQTYDNLEILLVDGGSDDGTQDICLDWKEEDSRVVYIRSEKNEGVSVSRNTGMIKAQGEYITFIDSDDYPAKDMIMTLYDILQENPDAQASGCGFETTDREGVPEWMQKTGHTGEDEKTSPSAELITSADFIRNGITGGDSRCWSKLYRREAIGDVRFPEDLTIGEDMMFVLDFMKHNRNIAVTKEKRYYYYRNRNGAMSRTYTHKAFDQITCWERAMAAAGDSPRLRSIILKSVMLTVGRIACLPKEQWTDNSGDIDACRQKLKEYKTAEAYALLDRGYKLKVNMFTLMPHIYMGLYHHMHE